MPAEGEEPAGRGCGQAEPRAGRWTVPSGGAGAREVGPGAARHVEAVQVAQEACRAAARGWDGGGRDGVAVPGAGPARPVSGDNFSKLLSGKN